MVYDVAVIGGGPAGVSAVLNVDILKKNYIWFAVGTASKKVERAELIKNYPALPDITGAQLAAALNNHAKSVGAQPCDKVISGVYKTGDCFTLLAGNESFEAKSVILCTGVTSSKTIDGEEKFLGRGVSYCATCDGFMFKGRDIVIICNDKHFEHEIEYLCNLANRAYVIPLYKDCAVKSENAEIILKMPVKFTGEKRLEGVEFSDGTIKADGVFVLKNSFSPATLVHGLNCEGGHIVVDRACRTNIAGLFAAGDCTGRPYQYVKAAGEGNVAAHSAVEYLSDLQ